MTKKRQLFFNLFFLLLTLGVAAQELAKYPSLQQVFEKAEAQFNCSFSYADAEIEHHYFDKKIPNSLSSFIRSLEKNTLFSYLLLPDNTVTVSLKEGVESNCFELVGGNTSPITGIYVVISDYQIIYSDSGAPFTLQLISNKDEFTVFDDPNTLQHAIVSNTPIGTNIPLSVIQDQKLCTNIMINDTIEQLNPITITNYLSKGITKMPEGGININYTEFDILPGLIESDVLLTLQALPGIQSVNETVSYLNIRGGTNDQNLILWDGIKMYQNGHFFGLISAFNPSLTKEVTVYKNGSDPEFGDGVSGVIKMEGNSSLVDSLSGSAGINLLSVDAYLELPMGKKASVQIAGRHSINGLVETPTYNAYYDKAFQNTEVVNNNATQTNTNDDFSFFDAHLRLQYQPTSKDNLRANVLILGNSLNFLESERLNDTNVSLASGLEQQNYSVGIFYQREWNHKLSTQIQLYGSSYGLMSTNQDISNNQRLEQENDILESGLKALANYTLAKSWRLQTGLQINETGATNTTKLNNPTFEKSEKEVLRTSSGFSKLSFSSGNRMTRVDVGLRVNYISKFDDFLWEPRFRFRQRLSRFFWIEALGEIKSQTTSQVIDLQNDFLGVENRRWVLSNPDEIPIIKGAQASLGITFRKNGLLLSATPYLKKIKGITSQSQGFENQFENIKTNGDYRVYGVDFLANKQLDNLNFWVSYSYAKNEYTFNSLEPIIFPNNIDLRHSITAGTKMELSQFTMAIGFNWHSGKPTTQPVNLDPIQNGILIFQSPNAQNIEPYFRVDASAKYSFTVAKGINGLAGISLWNLFSTNNTLAESYGISANNTVDKITDQSLSFTPNLFFKIRF